MGETILNRFKPGKPLSKEKLREAIQSYNGEMALAEIQFQNKSKKSEEKALLTRLKD